MGSGPRSLRTDPLRMRRRSVEPVGISGRPARWVQAMARHEKAFSAAPNFAFDLTARRATDDEMEGLDLGAV